MAVAVCLAAEAAPKEGTEGENGAVCLAEAAGPVGAQTAVMVAKARPKPV
jgi:hypothetical protein